jgi:hypothetical protein
MQRPFIRSCGPRQTCSSLLLCAAFFAIVVSSGAESHPLYAKLLGRLDANHLADGSLFFAKTSGDWKEGSCTLRAGTVLEGVVVRVLRRDRDVKQAEMDLRFHPVDCNAYEGHQDERHQVVPLLVAMDAPSQNNQDDNTLASTTLANTFANMVASHAPLGGGGPAKSIGVPDGGISSNPGAINGSDSSSQPLRIAETRGFSKVKLALPLLLTDPTILISPHALLIDRDTRFALVLRPLAVESEKEAAAPSDASPPRPSASTASAKAVNTPPAPRPVVPIENEAPDVDVCVESGCAIAGDVAATNTRLDRTLSLRALGYRVRSNQVLRSLADDAAVAFLGENQVLVTFNLHPLVKRSPSEADRATEPRIIRALLISATTGKVLRASEWRVPERGPYLWPLDKGHVLARTGNTLTIFGPSLVLQQQWTPPGTVRFVRISPSRSLIVVGIERERHTAEQHRVLAAFLGSDRSPEEDEDLTLLDEKLKVLGTEPLNSSASLPAILDSGIVLSDAGTRQKWMVHQLTWTHKKQPIVRVASSCPIRVDTLPTNLILLAGCAADGASYWYKVVRPDGKVLLTGTTPSEAWVESADAPPGGKVFAIGIAEATRPVNFEEGMVASDFNSVTVSIYRSTDGQRIFATRSSHGAVNRHSFALSEAGDRLAILSGDDLSLYRIQDTQYPGNTGSGHTGSGHTGSGHTGLPTKSKQKPAVSDPPSQ